MPDPYRQLEKNLGHQFSDRGLLKLALTHRSHGSANNERLEFLGDAIVNLVIAEALCVRFSSCREGELSRMRSQLVKGHTLAQLAREFKLGDYLQLGSGEMKSGGHRRDSILADTVEALIAAIYYDAGMDSCKARVLDWYSSRLQQINPDASNKDPKTTLQEFLQSRQQALPDYQLLSTSGSEHQQQFEVACKVSLLDQAEVGSGNNRRAAEQAAATAVLERLKVSYS